MPKSSLSIDWRDFQTHSDRLQDLVNSLTPLSPLHRKVVAEIVMVRTFLLIENTIASVCAKLLCGADYLDGYVPRRLVSAASIPGARNLIRTHGRGKPKPNVSWTIPREIRDNLVYTLQPNDPLFLAISSHANTLTAMRYIRNHVVHKNRKSRDNFRKIVRMHYGGIKQGVTPGLLLLKDGFGGAPLIDQYLRQSRVLVRDFVRA